MSGGYSGTPLAKKLSLKDGMGVWADAMPQSVRAEIAQDVSVQWLAGPVDALSVAHLFVSENAALETRLSTLRPLLASTGFIWVSWPKKAAKVPTDITENTIRDMALPMGYVDVKVCAVDAIWSGLKLMIRKELR